LNGEIGLLPLFSNMYYHHDIFSFGLTTLMICFCSLFKLITRLPFCLYEKSKLIILDARPTISFNTSISLSFREHARCYHRHDVSPFPPYRLTWESLSLMMAWLSREQNGRS
jgi:hypothetical protein